MLHQKSNMSPFSPPIPASLPDSLRACDTTRMRLSVEEAKSIRQCVLRFDSKAEVFLFGSRADDTRRGGDIDLLIVSKRISLRQRLRLQSALDKPSVDVLNRRTIRLAVSVRFATRSRTSQVRRP